MAKMTIFKNHFIFCSSLVFFFYLFFFQYPFFNYELGVLTSYVNNFNALNEISFWSGFFGDSFILSSSFNPLKLKDDLHKIKEKLDEMLKREKRVKLAKACFDFIEYRTDLDLNGWVDQDIFKH